MNKLPSLYVLRIFVRNRRLGGWTDAQIADALRKRLRWEEIDVDELGVEERRKWEELGEFMGALLPKTDSR